MTTRHAAALAALAGVAGAAVSVAAAGSGADRLNEAAVALVIAAYAVVGFVILWHRPGHPIGTLMLRSVVVWGVGEGLLGIGVAALTEGGGDTWGGLAATVGSVGRGLGWLVLVLWLPLVFPDGRPGPSRRLDRRARRFAVLTISWFTAVQVLSPYQTDLRIADFDNPLGLPHATDPVMQAAAGISLILGLVAIGLAVACLVQRFRHDSALVRQQVLWFALSFAAPVVLFVLSAWDLADPWMFGLASLPVPVAIGVAVLQRRLYDVQLVVNRSLTYGVLWLTIAVLYAVTVGGVGALMRDEGASWLPWVAAGVVAVSFAPLRDALQQAANKLTYGQWAAPSEVLASVGRRLGDATDVRALVWTLTTELGEGLELAAVQVLDGEGQEIGRFGPPEAATEELPLVAYGEEVGRIRWGGRRLREADRALMADLAGRLGAVVHAGRLLRVVRDAQERLVIAHEEERKRLRRELHDGLGPALAGLTLQVDTLRNTEVTEERLLALREGIQSTVLDVRRMVEGLRPPSLDELGLTEAVATLAARVESESRVRVDVTAGPVPRLPAAVEVAAYRIAQEALTNVVRHAEARECHVCLAARDEGLELVVRDDGRGSVAPRRNGVGLTSMRERAEEIGGRFRFEGGPGGTTVTAWLPVGAEVS